MIGNTVDAPSANVSASLMVLAQLIPATVQVSGHFIQRNRDPKASSQMYTFWCRLSKLRQGMEHHHFVEGNEAITSQFEVIVWEQRKLLTRVACDILAVRSAPEECLQLELIARERGHFACERMCEVHMSFMGREIKFDHIGAGRCVLIT